MGLVYVFVDGVYSGLQFGGNLHVDSHSSEYSIPSALFGLIKDLTRPTPPSLNFKMLSLTATLPVTGTAGSAGCDILTANDVLTPPHGRVLIPTDLAMAITEGWYSKRDSRSSLAWKAELDVKAGVIDNDYRGHVRVVLKKDTPRSYQVTKRDKIAQLIMHPQCNGPVEQVETSDDMALREAGFGSTGTRALDAASEKSTPPQNGQGSN